MPIAQSVDTEIHYDISGSGFPLLLMAGTAFSAATWPREFVAALEERFMVITYDQRGTGRSIPMGGRTISTKSLAIDAWAVLDHAGIDYAHVLGHSMGGMVAQQLAALFPERVASLILAASSAGIPEPLPPSRVGIPVAVARELIELGFAEFSTSKHHEVFFTPNAVRDKPELVRQFDEVFLSTAPSVSDYLRLVAARSAHSSREAAGRLTMPVLLIVGDRDLGGVVETRVEMTEVLSRLVPHAKLEYISGQSHCLLWEEPAICSDLVLRFLESTATR